MPILRAFLALSMSGDNQMTILFHRLQPKFEPGYRPQFISNDYKRKDEKSSLPSNRN